MTRLGSQSRPRTSKGAGLGGQSQRQRRSLDPEYRQAEPWPPGTLTLESGRWAALFPRSLLSTKDQVTFTPLNISVFSFLCKPLDGVNLYRLGSRNHPCNLFWEEIYFRRCPGLESVPSHKFMSTRKLRMELNLERGSL